MRNILFAVLLLAACKDNRPPQPTADSLAEEQR